MRRSQDFFGLLPARTGLAIADPAGSEKGEKS
jgi:hypothetical protein